MGGAQAPHGHGAMNTIQSAEIRMRRFTVSALFATALTPLIYFKNPLAPFILGKTLFFESAVEIALLLFSLTMLFSWFSDRTGAGACLARAGILMRNPLMLAILAFFASAFLSTIFAANLFHAIWGTVERGGGLWSLSHAAVFLVLSVLLFDRESWHRYMKVSVGVGAAVIFYTWLQRAGITAFPFALTPEELPGGFLGNPAFLGTYLVFVIGFAAFVFSRSSGFWWRAYAAFVMLSAVPTMFLTDVRGPLIGLAAGALFFLLLLGVQGESRSARTVALGALAAILLSAGIFAVTREHDFWRQIRGFRRLATLGAEDTSVKTRLIALGVSSRAFLERPLFGWGPENYNVAYNAHYNPDYARYEEAWFDRAHNIIAEVGVTQGVLGIAGYVFMLGAAAHFLLGRHSGNSFRPQRRILLALLVAYFVQNLFLFDTPSTHVMFFAVLGLILGAHAGRGDGSSAETPRRSRGRDLGVLFASLACIIFASYALYAYHYVPFRQAKLFGSAIQKGIGQEILNAAPGFLEPYNFLQPFLRFKLVEIAGDAGVLRVPEFNPLVARSILALEEVIAKEPQYDPRNYILLGETLNELAADDAVFYRRASEFLERAIPLAPKRQDIYYPLIFSLARGGRAEEAIARGREVVALAPDVAKAHYILSVGLVFAGEAHWDEAEQELLRAEEIGITALRASDMQNIVSLYSLFLARRAAREDGEPAIRIAGRLAELAPDAREAMEEIIRLTRAREWGAVRALLDKRATN